MKVLVEGKQMEVTLALQNYVKKHTRKLEKLGKKITSVHVFLESLPKKKNDLHSNMVICKVILPGKTVVVKKHAADMYEAIVLTLDGAARQVRKTFEKRREFTGDLAINS